MKKETNRSSEPSEFQKATVCDEMERLAYDHVLVENERYAAVRAWAGQIPSALYEVGRLRELAFRETGKGTGRKVDLDQFDLYYMHILIWSKEKQEITAACRIGQVDIILKRYGREGLYTGGLATFIPGFVRQEINTLEISKAFVRKEYQKQLAPILFLCRGIGKIISHSPHYRAFIGFISDRGSAANAANRSKLHQASGKVERPPAHKDRNASDILRLGGTISEDSALIFVDLTESRSGLRCCMDKAGSERFTEYHQARQDRVA